MDRINDKVLMGFIILIELLSLALIVVEAIHLSRVMLCSICS